MPLFKRDRYQRLDGGGGAAAARRPPSSFCSSATIGFFVALCLVAAWMMASSNNIAVTVSPDNNKPAAKDQDFARSDRGGDAVSDTPQTGGQAGDAGRKDDVDGGGGGTTQTRDEAGDGDTSEDGAGGDSGKKDDGAGDAQTTDPASNDVNRSDVAVATDATGNTTAARSTVAEGETPSKNQTFSDENGKTEGGEVAKPEDPDKKVEQSADQETIDARNATSRQAEKTTDQSTEETGGQADKNNAEETSSTDAKDTGGQTDKNAEDASTDDKNTGGQQADNSFQETSTTTDADNTGGQSNNSTNKETPAESEETSGGGGGTAKNQTTLDDVNGKMDDEQAVKEDGTAAEKYSDEAASSDKVESTEDDTSTGAASKDATSGGQNVAAETMAAIASEDGTNGTITPNLAMNSSATSQDKKDKAELLPSGQAELLNETASAVAENGTFPTQAAESSEEKASKNKKKRKRKGKDGKDKGVSTYSWKLCNVSTGADYIPCLDNEAAIRKLKSNKHYEHRERHCPSDAPTCLVPLPEGYRQPILWPYSRDKIWYHNVPHTGLASYKGHQNWVKVSGEHLTFPGGGTQFKHGALHYIEGDRGGAPGGGVGEAQPRGARRRLRRRQLRRLPVRQGRADHVVRAQGRARGAGAVRAGARHPGRLRRHGHQAPPLPRQRLRRHPLRAVPRPVAHRGRQAAAGGEPPPPPRRPLRLVGDARLPEGPGGRRDLARNGGAHQVHVLEDDQEDERHGGPDRHGRLQEADEQRLLRREAARGAAAVRGLRRPERGVEHHPAGVPAPRVHRPVRPRLAVAGAVAGPAGHDAVLAERRPGGRLRQARARRLRRGPGALEEGRRELVPRRHGHRLEERPERHGHESRLRRVCGGAPRHEGVGDERGDHRLAGHAAGDLRARALRDVP
ncbi:hypothetical protein PVAP13_3NG071500 [Panicum virgatum]|uniref:Methyltransferase n=1 Tax=Panicum virgatum TaxID=38727 RepID=A0A8T0U4I3_PANVG|nr:hypothetical protein PVAP13_3NG071500 [Panicum virgatum]